DVPVGVFLSGGLDSTAITKVAARYMRSPLTTVTVSFEDETLSEGKRAAEFAAKIGTRHIDVHLEHKDFAENLDRIVRAMDQPSIDGVNTYFVAKAAHEAGLKVALSGLGGDELFGGYPSFAELPRLIAAVSRIPLAKAFGPGMRKFLSPLIRRTTS